MLKNTSTNDKTLPTKKSNTKATTQNQEPIFITPFGQYFRYLNKIDKGKRYSQEFGSIMILSLLEEIGEMARAYLAEHGRKKTNVAAQLDETYEQELGDILLTILRFARIKKINLHERLMYSLKKVEDRKKEPKMSIPIKKH